MIHVITYGDDRFIKSRERAVKSIENFVDSTKIYTDKDLEKFKIKYPKILYHNARGGGFWLYKSLFLKETFSNCNEGDMIIWMDSGTDFIGDKDDITTLLNIATNNGGFCLFKQVNINKVWTKRDCFVYMGCDSEDYYNALQCDAAIQVYVKNDRTDKFIDELLKYCEDYRIITDSPNECGLPNLMGFKDHRHDQSILTNLCVKHKINRFKQPTEYGYGYIDWDGDSEIINLNDYERQESHKYKVIFNHHRERR
jgi:hypothetical protein